MSTKFQSILSKVSKGLVLSNTIVIIPDNFIHKYALVLKGSRTHIQWLDEHCAKLLVSNLSDLERQGYVEFPVDYQTADNKAMHHPASKGKGKKNKGKNRNRNLGLKGRGVAPRLNSGRNQAGAACAKADQAVTISVQITK